MADFYAVGPFEGQVCWGVVIEACGLKPLHAVEGSDGKLYTIATTYKSVSDHKNGRCWIRTKSKGAGLISFGVNAMTQPKFYEKTGGNDFKQHDVEYVTFKCVER